MYQQLVTDNNSVKLQVDDSKLKDVLNRVKELENEYNDLLIKYNMASQCVIEFIGRETKLVHEIDKLRNKVDDQDN